MFSVVSMDKSMVAVFSYLVFLAVVVRESSSQRMGYGQACNKTNRCISQQWLTCQDDVCDCAKPEEMLFDELRGHCVSKAGARCKFGFDESHEDYWYERTECVDNAECNYEGLCVCHSGYYENESGTCSTAKQYNETCKAMSKKECDQEKSLYCIHGSCQCISTSSIYLPEPGMYDFYGNWVEGGRCVGLAGSSCLNMRCTQFAYCDQRNQCKCNEGQGYIQTLAKTCGRGFGHQCEDEPCSEQFNCVDGTCQCKLSPHQIYDKELNLCMSLAGVKCTEREFPCVPNAQCTQVWDGIFHCECSDGYIENSKGLCDVAQGSPCQYGEGEIKCDTIAGLHCKNNICSCKSDVEVYDKERRRCLMPPGSRCHNNTAINSDSTILSVDPNPCVSNAVCTKSQEKNMGRCKCSEGYFMNITTNSTVLCSPIPFDGPLSF